MRFNQRRIVFSNKKILFTMLTCLALAGGLCLGISAADLSHVEQVRMTGRGVIEVAAENVTINFTIETSARREQDAREKNDAVMEEIRAMLEQGDELCEDMLYTREETEDGRTVVVRDGRLVSTRVGDTARIRKQLLAAGADSIYGVCYGVQSPERFSAQAMQEALKDAQRQADALETGRTLLMTEVENFGCYSAYDCPVGVCDRDDGKPVVRVECNISAIFRAVGGNAAG